jgi:hypothetical protein
MDIDDPYSVSLRRSNEEIARVHQIINAGLHSKKTYLKIRQKIKTKHFDIPSSLRGFVNKAYRIRVNYNEMRPRKCFYIIKESMSEDAQVNVKDIEENCVDLDQLHIYLLEKSKDIRNSKKSFLFEQGKFGYFLEKYREEYDFQYLHRKKETPWKDICKDIFNISDSYARKLRWFGKICHEFQIFRYITLSLDTVYKMKSCIDLIIKNSKYSAYQSFFRTLDSSVLKDDNSTSDIDEIINGNK